MTVKSASSGVTTNAVNAVEIFDGEVSLGTAIVGVDGKWSKSIVGLGSGSHNLTAREIGTEVTSNGWGFTVGSSELVEDFETSANASIPIGGTLGLPTMEVTCKGGELSVGGPYKHSPYVMGRALYFYGLASAILTLNLPVKDVVFGFVGTTVNVVVYYYDSEGILISQLRPVADEPGRGFVKFASSGSLVKKIIIDQGDSRHDLIVDNFTMSM